MTTREEQIMEALERQGLPTTMPFGKHVGKSLLDPDLDEGRCSYIDWMVNKPGFFVTGNSMNNDDMFIRVLRSMVALGLITHVTDIYGRTVRATDVLKAYDEDRQKALYFDSQDNPPPLPLPEEEEKELEGEKEEEEEMEEEETWEDDFSSFDGDQPDSAETLDDCEAFESGEESEEC